MAWMLNAVYLAVIGLASPWLIYRAIRTGRYRTGFAEKLFGGVSTPTSKQPVIWLHAVSVGEVQVLRTLIDQLSSRRPGYQFAISTTTATGMKYAQELYGQNHHVFYFPLDFTWAVNRVLKRLQPKLLVLAELEIWPNLISACQRHSCPVAVVNGRLSEKSFRGYQRIATLLSPTIAQLSLIAVQDSSYAERFAKLGARKDQLHVTGCLKFDGAEPDRCHPRILELRRLAGLSDHPPIFMAGSTQSPEEMLSIDAYKLLRNKHAQLKMILIPRHAERFEEVAALMAKSELRWRRRSQLDKADQGGAEASNAEWDVLLVDSVGELRWWWGLADIAFVGGSFGTRGGQNMLEPAAYGAAVGFGPNIRNFRQIVEYLLAADAATKLNQASDLHEWVDRLLVDPQRRNEMGRSAQAVVNAHRGATAKTVDLLAKLMPQIESDTSPELQSSTYTKYTDAA